MAEPGHRREVRPVRDRPATGARQDLVDVVCETPATAVTPGTFRVQASDNGGADPVLLGAFLADLTERLPSPRCALCQWCPGTQGSAAGRHWGALHGATPETALRWHSHSQGSPTQEVCLPSRQSGSIIGKPPAAQSS